MRGPLGPAPMQMKDEMSPDTIRGFELERKTVDELGRWIESAKEQAEYNREVGHADEKLEAAIQEAEQDHGVRAQALERRGF